MGEETVDIAGIRAVSVAQAGRGIIHPPCGSRSRHRWYCAATHSRHEIDARDVLERKGFAAFVPTALVPIRHARKTTMAVRAIFPSYLFVMLDLTEFRWRQAAHSTWVRHLFGAPEQPTPLPVGLIEKMMALGFDRPIVDDMTPALIAAGADVRITDGPFLDHSGVCQWDDGTRCRVLLSILGRELEVTLKRRQIAPIP